LSAVKILTRNLRELRKARGLTQVQLASTSGLDYKHYQKIEGGKWPGIRLDTVDRLAKALAIPAWELIRPSLDGPKIPAEKNVVK
jgi:transcriptional regulator with XRE-family HTH domain